ncbi:MAG: 3-phosphoshikimate 1-carboxyvinyltransferase [Eubacteriales bacterium]
MSITITPRVLSGRVTVPPSKSMAHRLLICAGLSDGVSTIKNIALSEDIKATLSALKAYGRTADFDGNTCRIGGAISAPAKSVMDCNESGSTLRFFVPIVSALGGGQMTGSERLLQRPLSVYQESFEKNGKAFKQTKPLTVPKGLHGGHFEAKGNISSQFISGVMLAAPLLDVDTHIVLTTPLESKGYVDMTIQAMAMFGVTVQVLEPDSEYLIGKNEKYQATEAVTEGDWSQSGFWALAGLASPEGIDIGGLDHSTHQGDRGIIDILKRMGVDAETKSGLFVKKTALLGAEIDISQVPDLAPVVAGLMAVSGKPGRMTGCGRLRIKESDRMESIASTLNNLGASAVIEGDTLLIQGKPKGGFVKTFNDHRIAMMAAALSAFCEKEVTIEDETVVNKSYPDFWQDFTALGGSDV